MYRALSSRDGSYDGLLFACVRTTGIFCRPTCHARKPKPENVEFAATVQDALTRGYRPCRLCDPLGTGAGEPNWLAPLIADIRSHPDAPFSDEALGARGLDPVQVRRTFKRRFGMTFQAWQRANRLGAAMRSLHGGASTIDAGLDAGFESDSGFRAAFARVFGASPGQARERAWLVAAPVDTPLGPMLAVAGDRGLEVLDFMDRRPLEDTRRELETRFDAPIVPGDHPILRRTAAQLAEYFAGRRRAFDLPVNLRGSEFQVAAWRALLEIPYGETRSYAAMARHVGSPKAVRAIGLVNSQNRIAIVVPCHRVIRSDGALSGYGGGKWRKQWLLEHEQSRIPIPDPRP
jgi:AraC family transcriptional regulator, regulatory protein of adaptative response / methylated-DNA-[protein]-cysteine methyltransferase